MMRVMGFFLKYKNNAEYTEVKIMSFLVNEKKLESPQLGLKDG